MKTLNLLSPCPRCGAAAGFTIGTFIKRSRNRERVVQLHGVGCETLSHGIFGFPTQQEAESAWIKYCAAGAK